VYGRGYQAGGLGFGPPVTPAIVKQLLVANGVVFLLQLLNPSIYLLFSITPAQFWSGLVWQPFTYMFFHGGLGHIAGNMFCLWMFGSPLALVWGPRRFLRFYLVCGVGAGLLIATLPALPALFGIDPPLTYALPTLGASGAVFGVLLAYSLTWPDRTIMLIFPPVAFRAIWLIPVLFFMEIYFGPPNVSHVGHLGGVLVGWLWLRREGSVRLLPSLDQVRWRWRRFRMRRRLRAVRDEELEFRQRTRWDDEHRLH
jgi:membrane associated rhomboid family serine protease